MNCSLCLNARVVRSVAATGLLMTMAGLGLSHASADLIVTQEHISFTESYGTFLPQESVLDYSGSAINTTNSQSGQIAITIVDGVQIGVKQTSTQSVNPAAAESKVYTKTQIVSLQDSPALNSVPQAIAAPVTPGTQFENTAGADQSGTFTISATDQTALQPGAVATLTFKVDGAFNPSQGLDLQAGPQGKPYNIAEFVAGLAFLEIGTFDLLIQSSELNPDDFETEEAYDDAVEALDAQIEANFKTIVPSWLISNQEVVDQRNQEFLDELEGLNAKLLSPGPVAALMSLDIPLDQADTSFEWVAQFLINTGLDASSGLDASIEMDFANTGIITLTIPQGFTVTSGSDLFPLSNIIVLDDVVPPGTSAVPEPVTAMLGAMSFAGLMIAARRRRVA